MIVLDQIRFRHRDTEFAFTAEIPSGASVAVIGPSGSGKTTLLHLIAGFLTPPSGRILVDGTDITAKAPHERPVTSVFQDHNLFAHLTLAQNVALGIRPDLRLTAEDRTKVDAALSRVGLEAKEHRLPGELSGGERQRVALARALVRKRPILLLDEPFAALGPALKSEMLRLVLDLQREHGLTVLLVSHDPNDARRAASHATFIADGKMSPVLPVGDVFGPAAPAGLAAYLGADG